MVFLSQAEVQEQRTAEQLQRRAAKMQAARQAAIKTLQQRREEKRQQAEIVAQEEIVSTCTALASSPRPPLQFLFLMQTVAEA